LVYFLYESLILRIVGAAVMSFLLVIFMGPSTIRFLLRRKLGDRPEFDHADLNELTRHKSDTPTMGGVLIVISIFICVLTFSNLSNGYVRMSLMALVWLGALGAVDDWYKLRQATGGGSRDGLRSWEKLLFQIALAVLLAVAMYFYGSQSYTQSEKGMLQNPPHQLYLPFRTHPLQLPLVLYVIVVVLTMVGTSNGVNLTDGMDGLASGCVMIAAGVLLVLSWISGVEKWAQTFHMPLVYGSEEMTILCAAILGSCMGFLWYNAHPAQVFMGDTGSLPLGGLLGYTAVVIRNEPLLVLIGGVFVMESVSVILQVGYFKMTKKPGGIEGKRLFRVAPLHHHFHLGGWAEPKVVVRFWLLGIIFAALSLATLKLR
jgi:phospho-N-acetylmuramoyl-pentapeptide-transferase